MQLGDLLSNLGVLEHNCDLSMEISGISYDTRTISGGNAFVAIPGIKTDRHAFVWDAVNRGAAVCIVERRPEDISLPYVRVGSTLKALALMSAAFYNQPANALKIIGVTGTNGKTTVTTLIKGMLEELTGKPVGLIGTNGNLIGDIEKPSHATTPEAPELHRLFAEMVSAGCSYAVMEVSSHSLATGRVWGINFAASVFTNLTQDHLDFHGDMENYAAAKAQLFAQSDRAVMNYDDEYAPVMAAKFQGKPFYYSVKENAADLVAKNIRLLESSVKFEALATGKIARVRLNIPGQFSVYNALAALGACLVLGFDFDRAAEVIEHQKGVRGRLDVVPIEKDYTVIIDYAHTPDGLEKALAAVAGFATARIITVFGCGGDRDKTKRPKMGEVVGKYSDVAIVTSDNPRSEEPMDIIKDILPGLKDSPAEVRVIENRRGAIAAAMAMAREKDIILIAGKGHEDYQEIKGVRFDFDEFEIVRELSKG